MAVPDDVKALIEAASLATVRAIKAELAAIKAELAALKKAIKEQRPNG